MHFIVERFACVCLILWPVTLSNFDKLSVVSSQINKVTDVNSCHLHRQPNTPDVICDLEELLHGKLAAKDGVNKHYSELAKEMSGGSLSGLYRPRSALARALYEKQRNDRELRQIDKTEWYRVEKSRLSPELQSKFVQLWPDAETKQFIADSIDKSSWIWTQIWYLLARLFLKYFWSITDINGWLGRGSMFVLSEEQLMALVGDSWGSVDRAPRSMVDVGAGDGEVSRRWSRVFPKRCATEISASMRKLLATKGFTVLDAERWWQEEEKYDCVCMLNLLDRCSRPRTMLQQARAAIAPGGTLMVALVLPCKPYVEVTPDHKPEEKMPVTGVHFEEQVTSFVEFMRAEMSFELVRWARVPYLCEGDVNQAYYWLDDSVYIFRTIDAHAPPAHS